MSDIMDVQVKDRIAALRHQMNDAGVSAVIIPQTDPHQSEYLASHWQVRRYMSGFTGSAGTLVVTADDALLWTDSRYFIQAAAQLEGTGVCLMKDGLSSTPSIEDYLISHLGNGAVIGVDGMLFSALEADRMRAVFAARGITFVTDFDIADAVWPQRPPLPKGKIFIHDEKYAGKSAREKIADILAAVKSEMGSGIFISPLDEVAWTLNIRCNDVKYNPVATAYLYLSSQGSTLLIDPDKITPETEAYLASQGVGVKPYDSVKEFVSDLPADIKVHVEGGKTSATIAGLLGARVVYGTSPVGVLKGVKNAVQIAGVRAAMVRDGVAMVKAFKELDHMLSSGIKVTELDVAALLLKYRSRGELFFDESFGTIAGYGPHGAIVHYEADENTSVELKPDGLLLVDSGAQYLDGTTDITRTISLGNPTALQRRDFTLVMKGHIALATAVFPENTRGAQLDVLARQFLWKDGLSYLHGTGHGVGHFLNVHEGPQSIRLNNTPVPLMPGMITSDEPGLYREGVHGVRCENLVLCVPAMTTDFGRFLKFETLTLFPFDLSLFDTEIMSRDEIKWVNDYHAEVWEKLSPALDADEKEWLCRKTATLA